MNPLSTRIGAAGMRAPKLTLTIAVIAALLTLVLALPRLDRLSGALASDPATESAQAADLIHRATGHAAEPAFFAIVTAGTGHGESLDARSTRVQKVLRAEHHVAQVDAFDPANPSSRVLRSRDGTHDFISVTLDTPQGDGRTDATMRRLISKLDRMDGVQLGGTEFVTHEITSTIADDLHVAELVIIPILLLLTLWFFRSVAAALVPVVIAGLAALLTMLALVVTSYFVHISNFALNITSALAMGLGIDYGLLLVSRFREQLAAGDAVTDAVRRTMSTAGRAVMFSAATVGASMASLLIFPQSFINSIGAAGLLVAAISGLSALLVVPALLVLLGRNIDAIAPRWMQRRASVQRPIEQGGWYRLTMFVSRRAAIVMVLAALVIVLLALPARHARFIISDVTVLPKSSPARTSIEDAARWFPELSAPAADIVVPGPSATDVVADATRIVGTRADVEQQPAPIAKGLWKVRVLLHHREIDDRSLDVVRDLRRELPKRALVQGLSAQQLDARSSIFGHAPLALLIVVAATVLFILTLTGSIVLAVKTVIMNALTLSAMFGVLVYVFQYDHLGWLLRFTGQGGLEVGEPMIICALVFGLSTDYGVFLLARVKESYDAGNDTTTALAIGTERTGRVITTAALLFCVAMAVSGASRLVTVKQVGFGVAYAVLLDATLVRAVLVPATMQVLGRWNWWAPGFLGRIANRSVEH